MKVEVKVTESFKKAAKPLIKKYKSFLDDLSELEARLLVNPETGAALGNNAYKIRLRIKSKGKAKAAGQELSLMSKGI
jgi:mRNA-degrading endonuclease RelE of RelBE toxin-antitoxin system